MSQLIAEVNVPTQEEDPVNDPEVPARSHEELVKECVKNIPKSDPNLDWAAKIGCYDDLNTGHEEQQEQEVGLNYDSCLPSLSAEPISQDLGCSGQRFEQESNQSEPIDLKKECSGDGAEGHLGSGFQLPGYKPSAPGGLWAAYAQELVHAQEEFSLATG